MLVGVTQLAPFCMSANGEDRVMDIATEAAVRSPPDGPADERKKLSLT
jgi:hypothetical protein